MELSITIVIILITVLVSIGGFNNQKIIDDLIFYPPAISGRNQWYRFFTCGFIHADWGHLIFNMYALYIFGAGQRKSGVEYIYKSIFDGQGAILYLLMYVAALAACLLPTFAKHKHDHGYRSLGASGAVSAVIFTFMLFYPTAPLGLVFVPIYVSGFLFGAIYLIVSSWLANRGHGNINHSAHIWGAVFGIAFTIVACKLFSGYPVLQQFIDEIKNMNPSDIIKFG
jgi:membrane associated rhomboid family serine protease